jgi:hypothetical protein
MLEPLVVTESRFLLEHHVAALEVALVRVVQGVRVDVLVEVLLLREAPTADLAPESLHAHVDSHEVALKAEAG